MRKLVLTFVAAGLYSISGNAQALFTYGSNSVSKDDFLRVYKKNSINKKPDMSDTALKSYLDLYALFRMKVAEADKQQLDTVPNISKELDNYRKQLAKNYLTDEEITNKLVREAYDRMKENVRVAHLLVSCPPGTDTMAAYRKIDSLYHVIETKKADFETITKQFSDDRGTKENGGDVGYFTALQTIYAFENKAYTTPVGKISAPFRTQFGYHIMKVLDKRADKGELKVAQILIQVAKSKGEAGDQAARKRADSVVAMLKAGTPFAELVSKYSDDQFSKNDTGVLKQFGAGKMVLAFENAAYALKKPGDISEPVKTEFGYHIIKLIAKYPLAPYDTLFPKLKRKVENDARAQTARDHFMNKIKEKNGFKEFPENAKEVSTRLVNTPDTGEHARDIIIEDYKYMTKPVFTLAGKNYLQNDFVKFLHMLTRGKLNGPKATVISDAYNMYITTVVNDFQEHKLVEENPEFKHLMEEYRDGIMLFELMDRNVWSKASKDSAGLKKFFEERKSKYMWEPGFEGAVYKFKNKAALDSGIAMIKSGTMNEDQIAKEMNTTANPDRVTIQKGHYEFSKFKDATPAELNRDNMKISIMPDGKFNLVHARKIYSEPTQKTLEDARGYVVAEYQDYLEKQWNAKMRSDYPMKVNDKVFKSMIKK